MTIDSMHSSKPFNIYSATHSSAFNASGLYKMVCYLTAACLCDLGSFVKNYKSNKEAFLQKKNYKSAAFWWVMANWAEKCTIVIC